MNNNNAFDQFFCYSVYFLPWALILQGIKNEISTDFFNFGCFWVVSFIIFLPPPPPPPPGLCLMMRGWEAYLVPWHHLVGPWLSSLHLVIWGGTLSYLVLVIDRGRLLIHTPWPHLKTSCPWFFVQDALYYQCSLLLWLPWNGWRLYKSAWWTYQDTTLEYTFTAFCWEAAGCFQVPPRDMRYKSSLWSSLSIYLEFHYPY